jgi:hypothetical protein
MKVAFIEYSEFRSLKLRDASTLPLPESWFFLK